MANYSFGKCNSINNKEEILLLKSLGTQYIEGNLTCISEMSDSEIDDCAAFSKSDGLPILSTNCFFPGAISLVGSNVDYVKIDEYIAKAFERAEKLGVGVSVFGSGRSRRVPDEFPEEKAFEQLCILCAEHIAPVAKKRGITCVIEPLNQGECNIVYSTERAMRIINAVNLPQIQLLVDFYHFDLEHEPIERIAEYSEHLKHIHISAPVTRLYPKPDDGIDYSVWFDALRNSGYSGIVSLEGKCPDISVDVPPALEILHNA